MFIEYDVRFHSTLFILFDGIFRVMNISHLQLTCFFLYSCGEVGKGTAKQMFYDIVKVISIIVAIKCDCCPRFSSFSLLGNKICTEWWSRIIIFIFHSSLETFMCHYFVTNAFWQLKMHFADVTELTGWLTKAILHILFYIIVINVHSSGPFDSSNRLKS